MTHLCVAIFVTDLEKALADASFAGEAGADLVEYRIDTFAERDQAAGLLDQSPLIELIQRSALPCIVTCRASFEGGQSDAPDGDRLETLDTASRAGASYIDLELVTFRATGRGGGGDARLILSSHDFTGRPARLLNIVAELNDSPADIAKIVWTARTVRDNLEAFEILLHRRKPTIAICMGEAGVISRILAKKFGAFLTFASLTRDGGTAPGQVSIHDMKRLYRWDALGPKTKVYGVVASPVAHSMSPAIHNAAFTEVGHDGVYLPLLVNEGYESFKAFMETFLAFEPLDLSGLSVTLPHKENALRYLKERGANVEPLAERIGAVNTIVIDRSTGSLVLRGLNTDYAAILDSITDKLGITRDELAGKRVAVLGAGGTGRTAVAALAHYGATVVVYNRTLDRAKALAEEFTGHSGKVVAAPIEKLCDSCCEVYINTTSVGMHPNVDASPLGEPPPKFSDQTLVFDTIYNPPLTRLLQHAQNAGAKTIGGIEMFVRQAATQFEAWTGVAAPRDIMRQVVEQRLAAISHRA